MILRSIPTFLGLTDLDKFIRDTDPAPDPSIINKISKKKLDTYYFATSL
jgi:hypothetical protein